MFWPIVIMASTLLHAHTKTVRKAILVRLIWKITAMHISHRYSAPRERMHPTVIIMAISCILALIFAFSAASAFIVRGERKGNNVWVYVAMKMLEI
jgi:hypothetical protein